MAVEVEGKHISAWSTSAAGSCCSSAGCFEASASRPSQFVRPSDWTTGACTCPTAAHQTHVASPSTECRWAAGSARTAGAPALRYGHSNAYCVGFSSRIHNGMPSKPAATMGGGPCALAHSMATKSSVCSWARKASEARSR